MMSIFDEYTKPKEKPPKSAACPKSERCMRYKNGSCDRNGWALPDYLCFDGRLRGPHGKKRRKT